MHSLDVFVIDICAIELPLQGAALDLQKVEFKVVIELPKDSGL